MLVQRNSRCSNDLNVRNHKVEKKGDFFRKFREWVFFFNVFDRNIQKQYKKTDKFTDVNIKCYFMTKGKSSQKTKIKLENSMTNINTPKYVKKTTRKAIETNRQKGRRDHRRGNVSLSIGDENLHYKSNTNGIYSTMPFNPSD